MFSFGVLLIEVVACFTVPDSPHKSYTSPHLLPEMKALAVDYLRGSGLDILANLIEECTRLKPDRRPHPKFALEMVQTMAALTHAAHHDGVAPPPLASVSP